MTQSDQSNTASAHGTEARYNHQGCRCDACTAAIREARARRRAAEDRYELRRRWREDKRRRRVAR